MKPSRRLIGTIGRAKKEVWSSISLVLTPMVIRSQRQASITHGSSNPIPVRRLLRMSKGWSKARSSLMMVSNLTLKNYVSLPTSVPKKIESIHLNI